MNTRKDSPRFYISQAYREGQGLLPTFCALRKKREVSPRSKEGEKVMRVSLKTKSLFVTITDCRPNQGNMGQKRPRPKVKSHNDYQLRFRKRKTEEKGASSQTNKQERRRCLNALEFSFEVCKEAAVGADIADEYAGGGLTFYSIGRKRRSHTTREFSTGTAKLSASLRKVFEK